jgi:hypothetical protein
MNNANLAYDVMKTVFCRFLAHRPNIVLRVVDDQRWSIELEHIAKLRYADGKYEAFRYEWHEIGVNKGLVLTAVPTRQPTSDMTEGIVRAMEAYTSARLQQAVEDDIENRKPG